MLATFDIFKVNGGELRWLEAAHSLQAAKARIEERGETSPGTFVIFNQETQQKILVTSDSEEKQSPRSQPSDNSDCA